MRTRGLVALATTLTACAAVTGLGDYEIAPEDLPPATADGSSPDAGVDGSTSGVSPILDGSVDAPLYDEDAAPGDAGPTVDLQDATAPEAGTDAEPPSPTASLACQGTTTCNGTLCCVNLTFPGGYKGKCADSASGCTFPYACDSNNDCGAGMKCCVKIENDSDYAIASSCRSDCGALKTACQSKTDCSGTSCVKGGYQDVIQNLRYCR